MKLLNIDWWQFFSSLEMYRELPESARRMFIDHVKPSAAVSQNLLLPWWPALNDSGLMAVSQTGVNANVKIEHREFSRAIRAMSRSRILDSPSRDTLHGYLNDNLTNSETAALGGSYLYGRTGFEGLQRLFAMVSSASWAKKFLSAKADWERDYADPAQPRYFSSPEVLKAAQVLVRAVADQEHPVLLHSLPGLLSGISSETFSGAMRGVLRYLLLFPALRAADLEPIIGLWPGVADKLANKPLTPLTGVAVSQVFQAPFLMDDMVSVLSACAAAPIRLRSGDLQIFEADRKGLSDALASLPEWIEQTFRVDADIRISRAVEFLDDYDFAERTERPEYRLRVTTRGAQWLAMQPKQRLQLLLDGLKDGAKVPEKAQGANRFPALIPGVAWMGSRPGGEKLVETAMAAFTDLPPEVFVRVGDFLHFESRNRNALAETVHNNRNFTLHIGGVYMSSPSEEEVDNAWQGFLSGLLNLRLLPLGGAQIAVESGAKNICFALTDTGRYLLGTADDFDIPPDPDAQILIQPNFDVVFLAASAPVEAEIARFAERKGRHIGTLFRITKASVQSAAAAGLTADRILETLRGNCPTGIPPNVSSEIANWFRRYRQVNIRQAIIVQCPDEETSAAIISMLGKKATRLSATVLEVDDRKIQPAVAKKLRDAGIFIRAQ